MNAYRRFAVVLLLGTIASSAFGASDPPAHRSGPLTEKCGQLLDRWKDKFAEENMTALIAPPFVVAGDGSRERIESLRDNTILSAMRCLQATFFAKAPDEPILILLFETEKPYRRLARKWFNDANVSYYGYFRHDNVMLMNVGTGGGTLVHELTHALIKPDFPNVPSWFNEGFASLYEQCSLGRDNTIKGHENWRLPALQKAIKANTLRPLTELIQDPKFYRDDLVGLNYAQARYTMFYLQEKKLLQAYYTTFRDAAKDDPTGLDSLKKVIAPQSLEEFEKEWSKWVLGLEFGRG